MTQDVMIALVVTALTLAGRFIATNKDCYDTYKSGYDYR